jgi:hypothetical protein
MRPARVKALVLCAAACLASAALAAEPTVRTTGLNRRGGKLLASVGVQDLMRPADVARLTSGFATRVVIQVVLARLDTRTIVAQAFRHTEIVYDLWEEKFRVRTTAWRSLGRMETSVPTADRVTADAAEALAQATELRLFPVVELGGLEPGGTYQLRFHVDLNPLSPDVVAEVRHWLVRPPAQGHLGPADSFFGSFVSIFVNPQIEESDRRIEFLSQPFLEPPR